MRKETDFGQAFQDLRQAGRREGLAEQLNLSDQGDCELSLSHCHMAAFLPAGEWTCGSTCVVSVAGV